MIKKVFLICLIVAVSSCSKDDDKDTDQKSFINPPEWIIGTWMDESLPDIGRSGGYQFTDDNLIVILSNGEVFQNLKEGLKESVDFGVITSNEIITDTDYRLEILVSGTVTNTFEFKKGSNNTAIIDLTLTRYPTTLTKQ